MTLRIFITKGTVQYCYLFGSNGKTMIVLETSGGGFVLLPLVSYFGTFCPKVPTRGDATTATTYIRPYKQAAGLSAVQTMEERFAYGLNPQKLGAVSSHLCDPATAAAEFLLVKSEYQAATARPVERGALFFQIRQAFPPGEVTAEEANKLGFETAMRWTKGKYQFFVCTHTDKGHIHNHIYFNSTAFDCSRKFHNFLGSSFALRRLSDRVCLEHDLSVIQNPKLHSKGRFLHYGQWIGDKPPSAQQRVRLAIIAALEKKPADFAAFLRLMEESGFAVKRGRGGVVSFLAPGQDKYTRPGRWGLSLTFKSAWPRARARLMSGGRKSTI